MNDTDIKRIEDTIKSFDFEDAKKEIDDKTRKRFRYVGIYHIERRNVPDSCGQKFCGRIPTEYIEIELFGIPLHVPLCKNHSEQIQQFIIGKEILDEKGFPIVYCKDDGNQYYFYCKYCQKIHFHGRKDGHRVAHCSYPSPYREKGYILKLASEV